MAKRKICAFCGSSDSKITNEHVWPLWARELLGGGPSSVTGYRSKEEHFGSVQFCVKATDTGLKVNAVCRVRCNSGWMAKLEDAARVVLAPIIRGDAFVTFNAEGRRLVALWGLKTAMVLELTSKDSLYFDQQDREALRALYEPPDWLMVWVGRYSGANMTSGFGVKLDYSASVGQERVGFSALCSTITIGQLCVQVLSLRPPKSFVGATFKFNEGWGTRLHCIWPNTSDVFWPPADIIDGQSFTELLKRFVAPGYSTEFMHSGQ